MKIFLKNGFKLKLIIVHLGLLFSFSFIQGQSEHAKEIAKSLIGTKNESYADDILVNKPDYIVYVPKKENMVLGDNYNDHFQVFNNNEGKLFAVWTQASKESDIDQHIAFSKSQDKGLTWSEPIVLAGSKNKKNPQLLASWQQPMVSKSGRIYVLWNQQINNLKPHFGLMFGIYTDDEGETWSSPKKIEMPKMERDSDDPLVPPRWCNWQRPLRLGKDDKYLVGVSRHGTAPNEEKNGVAIEFLQFDNIDSNPSVDNIKLSWFATNKDALKVEHEKFGSACEEASIVKLPDGRLFSLMRTSSGYPFWSQSRDNGVTWSKPEILRERDGGKPYLHPRSPCPIYDWKGPEAGSGYYFAFVHNTFDFNRGSAYQNRGPLYLIAGKFNPKSKQPIEFAPMKVFSNRPEKNSFYTSVTFVDGKTVLWFPDKKFYLLGRIIGQEWFDGLK